MYIETRGPTLEEIAKIIDGEDAKVVPADIERLQQHVASLGLDKEHTIRYEDIKLDRH